MPEKIEKFHISRESEKENKETFPIIEVPKEEWQTLKIIAKRVAGDFKMEVKLGPPYLEEINPLTGRKEKIPYVAFEDPEEKSIRFNPLFIKEHPREAKRVAAHEGAHRAITRGEHEIGLSEEQIRKLSSPEYLGFHSFNNIGLEDPRVNNYDTGRFPGLKEINKEVYDKQLKEENAQFIAPEVNLIISRLGRYPRYAEAASELLRFWHQNRYSKKLKPEIKKFLNRVQKYAQEYQQNIPDVNKPHITEKEVFKKAQECFTLYHDYIWPEVKKLVEMDLLTEQQRQMLKDLKQKQKELEQKQKQIKEAQKQGDTQRTKQLQKEIEELKNELENFNKMPDKARQELEKEIDKAIKETAQKLNKEIEEKQKELNQAKQKQEELGKEIQELEKKAGNASGKEKEDLNKEIEKKKIEKLNQEMKQKQAEKEIKDIQDALDDIQSGKEMPYPEDKLSEETKQELKELFNKLSKRKQKELKERAQRQLENLEDKINKELEGKLNEDNPESHEKRREREKKERQAALKSQQAKKATEKIQRELERIRKEKMTPYERARAEILPLIDDLYYRLRKILKPEEFGGKELGWPSGKELDITRAMQTKKDLTQKEKMWIRESAPEKKDYRFWHLVDLSGSMRGTKIHETFKGFIVATEAIDKIENLNSDTLTVHQGITGFHNKIFPFKNMKERLSKEIEDKLATMERRTHDENAGTNTYAGTIEALKGLKQNLGESGNYLLVFSDGEPNYDIRDKLKKILKENKKERKKLNIKIGLIWLGESENEKDLKKLVEEYGYDFGLVMSAVSSKNKKKNFAEKLADLMENLVKEPEKY